MYSQKEDKSMIDKRSIKILNLTNQYGKGFLECFRDKGFAVRKGVAVSSRIDPSVFLVGSTISVLKPYLLCGKEIPRSVMIQRAIRTQSLRIMEKRMDTQSIYGSYFLAMGTLAPYEVLGETLDALLSFLENIIKDDASVMLRVSSKDADLLTACTDCADKRKNILIEMDQWPDTYYRHHYGLDRERITGRNFNLAVLCKEDCWADIGNIIVIEKNGVPFAVEAAMGMSTLITHLFGLPHTMLGNIVADIFPMKNLEDFWIGDCVSVVNCLRMEGVIPNSSRMQGRLLKRYEKVLQFLCREHQLNSEILLDIYREYEKKLLLPL